MAASTDYDAPRTPASREISIEELQARRVKPGSTPADADGTELADSFEIPEAEQIDEELTATVVPMQVDEFRCDRCFLITHHSQRCPGISTVCRDCA